MHNLVDALGPLAWSVVLDLRADPSDLTAALVDIPSVSRDERRIADEVQAALRAQSGYEVIRNGDAVLARTDHARASRVILAVPPYQVARLLDRTLPDDQKAPFEAFEYEPIATVWLGWGSRLQLPAITMLDEDIDTGQHGQWLFARTAPTDGAVRSLAGVVVSAAGRADAQAGPLAQAVATQVAAQLGCPRPDHARAIVDKRATVRCSPGRPRIDADSLSPHCPGLFLAGDWVWHAYPATIESAVRSGLSAADHCLRSVPARD